MNHRIVRTLVAAMAGFIVALAPAFAQPPEEDTLPLGPTSSWEAAQASLAHRGRLFVITAEQPHRRQICHVQQLTAEKLVCSHGIGRTRTYLPAQIAALILPGDKVLTIAWFLGSNAGLGASIWGTLVLAAACPLCAAGTAAAALFFFDIAGAALFSDGEPERVVYLAPNQKLEDMQRFVH
jgi:hypothetical protein